MRKKLRFYKQHSMETCGPACMLMLLDYYCRISYPTPKMELEKIYPKYRVNGYKGVTGAAVANCLSFPKNGLKVHLVQSFCDRMDNRDGYFPEEIYENIMGSHKKHIDECRDRIRLSVGKDFDLDFLRQELEDGKKIVLECFIPEEPNAPPSVLHWVILEDYDAQTRRFRVRDPNPQVKLLHLTEEEVRSCMDTPIGKICITVSDGLKRDGLQPEVWE